MTIESRHVGSNVIISVRGRGRMEGKLMGGSEENGYLIFCFRDQEARRVPSKDVLAITKFTRGKR